MSTWMRKGGDKYQMFLKNRIKLHPGEDAARLVAEYIDYLEPIRTGIDERITFVTKPKVPGGNCTCNNVHTVYTTKPYVCASISLLLPSNLMVLGLIMAYLFLYML